MSKSTLKCAMHLTTSADAHLVGVFPEVLIYDSHSLYEVRTTRKNYEKIIAQLNKENAKKRVDAINEFHLGCEKAGIVFSLHMDECISIQELKKESMYADPMIINEMKLLRDKKNRRQHALSKACLAMFNALFW